MDQVALDLGEFRPGQGRADRGQRLRGHILPECPQGASGVGRQAAEDLWARGMETNKAWGDCPRVQAQLG